MDEVFYMAELSKFVYKTYFHQKDWQLDDNYQEVVIIQYFPLMYMASLEIHMV